MRRANARFACAVLIAIVALAAVELTSTSLAQTVADRAVKLIEQAGQHHENREWKAAINAATEALKLDPNSAVAHTIRGDAKTQIKDYKGAIADLTEALRLDPKSGSAYINRGAA